VAVEQFVYIIGSGRSGSTLVERILHTSPDIASVGELHCLWRLPAQALNCSCAERFDQDAHWRDIVADSGLTHSDFADLARLEGIVARSSFIARHGYDLARLAAVPDVRQFVALNFRLIDAIGRRSGAKIVVDSSKAGPRAWLLATDQRTRILHIYRRPGDVMASWRARKFDPGIGDAMQRLPVPRAALDWAKAEHFARRLRGQAPLWSMRYDALANAPVATVAAALKGLGLGGYAPPQWLDERRFRDGDAYHSLNGNPDRFSRADVVITPRAINRDSLDTSDRMLIALAAGLLRTAYPERSVSPQEGAA